MHSSPINSTSKKKQFAHKQRVDQAELDLARQADDITAIASPN